MSENLESQNVANSENFAQGYSQNVQNGGVNTEKQRIDFMNGLADYVIERYNNKQTEAENRRKTIETNLADYDSNNYLKNQDFMNLYNEAIDILGDDLDTKKFIGLLDKYVDSRIASNARVLSAKNENSSLTDSFAYNAGSSAKPKDKRKFQDLKPEEIPLYVAKYI